MIRLHSLCWIVGLVGKFALYNGRVVEVIGPLATREMPLARRHAKRWHRGYLCDALWMRELYASLPSSTPYKGTSIEAEHLMPFSDPSDAGKERASMSIGYDPRTTK